MAGLTMDRAGNLYGTTPYGGNKSGSCAANGGCGGVFKLSKHDGSWLFTPLYNFTGGSDGDSPMAGVTIGPDGSLYGTTYFGGNGCQPYGCGTVYRLTPPLRPCNHIVCSWTETVIYRFADNPTGLGVAVAGVAFDTAGNLYGAAALGGAASCSCGAIYKLSPAGGSWTASILYSFTGGSDGELPEGTPAFDQAGNLFGTTLFGGWGAGYGTVWELIRSGSGWLESTLYQFHNLADGGYSDAGVIFDSAGNLYGDNESGGLHGGAVFEMSRLGGDWTYTVLGNPRGGSNAPLALDSAGNLYGTTYGGGRNGLIYELSYVDGAWTEIDLYDFSGGNGGLPYGSVTVAPDGTLYGTATGGGTEGQGVAWQITQ
jgi:uncharacterized repeat protein (TIGR03803 family)